MSDLGRFDTGHRFEWTPKETANASVTTGGGPTTLYSFDPFGIGGPQNLRVDYLSVCLDFAILDLDAAATIYMKLGGGFSTPIALLSTAIGGPTTDTHLRSCAQLSQPFYVLDVVTFSLAGVSSGTSSSVCSATIGVSTAYRLET